MSIECLPKKEWKTSSVHIDFKQEHITARGASSAFSLHYKLTGSCRCRQQGPGHTNEGQSLCCKRIHRVDNFNQSRFAASHFSVTMVLSGPAIAAGFRAAGRGAPSEVEASTVKHDPSSGSASKSFTGELPETSQPKLQPAKMKTSNHQRRDFDDIMDFRGLEGAFCEVARGQVRIQAQRSLAPLPGCSRERKRGPSSPPFQRRQGTHHSGGGLLKGHNIYVVCSVA